MTKKDEGKKAFLQKLFASHFGGDESSQADRGAGTAVFASAPGRVELAGNHTDHQGGRTISAAIDQRSYALAVPTGTDKIRVFMDGFGEASLHLCDLEARRSERRKPIALIRGMAAAYARSGGRLCGFDMVTCSDIPVGCGLSSSAAFEVLIGTSIRALCDPVAQSEPPDPLEIALDGVWAERGYFGKPCGAQDQLASAFGGIAAMDFSEDKPYVTPLDFDIGEHHYALYLVDSRCDHSHYADEFAAIPADMQAVAQYFDCTKLDDVPYHLFLKRLQGLRARLGDRAVLRALHYFEETRRVSLQQQALEDGAFDAFLEQARLSGASSAQFLQSVSPASDGSGANQPAMVILALCAHVLDGGPSAQGGCSRGASSQKGCSRGAYRIHGGGFGGGILAFVPEHAAGRFQTTIDSILGYDACMQVSISSQGATSERMV